MTQLTSFKTTTNSSTQTDTNIDSIDSMDESVSASLDEIHSDILALKDQINSTADCSELLIRIHKDLYKKPECFAVLSDEEISTVIAGIKQHTKRELMVGKEKTRLKKNFSMDDLDL